MDLQSQGPRIFPKDHPIQLHWNKVFRHRVSPTMVETGGGFLKVTHFSFVKWTAMKKKVILNVDGHEKLTFCYFSNSEWRNTREFKIRKEKLFEILASKRDIYSCQSKNFVTFILIFYAFVQPTQRHNPFVVSNGLQEVCSSLFNFTVCGGSKNQVCNCVVVCTKDSDDCPCWESCSNYFNDSFHYNVGNAILTINKNKTPPNKWMWFDTSILSVL